MIVIPSGITVNLDQNVVLNGVSSALTVNGALTSSTGKALILASTTLGGSGSINVDSVAMSAFNSFTYTGSITAQALTSTGATIAAAASITVTKALRLKAGTLSLAYGSLNMAANSIIVVSGGVIAQSSGVLSLTNAYNLRYEGSGNMTSGLELNGTGLKNLEIATASSAGMSLNSDLTVNGTLTLSSGYLRLNNHNLTFGTNGDFSASGTGTIVAGRNSNLSFSAGSSFTGGLRFRSDSSVLNNLTVNMGSTSATARMGTNLTVAGNLTLINGRLDLDSNTLAVTGGTSGGAAGSYIVTGNGGRLGFNIGVGNNATYHVGTNLSYAPANISANLNNASGMLYVGVQDGVRAQGTTGVLISATRKMVNATWHVTSDLSSSININLTTMWNASMELNGFNRNQVYLSHYTAGAWDMSTIQAAGTASAGMYSANRAQITSLSPFAVMDRDALGITKVATSDALSLYPNPSTGSLHINSKVQFTSVRIYNAAGEMVKSSKLTGNTLSIESLPAGNYYASFQNEDGAQVQSFTKL
jgi:hypothetical protein